MQRVLVPIPNGAIEFLEEIEPWLGDVAKNLSAIIGRALPADQLLLFQTIQQAGYARCLLDHSLCDVQCRKSPETCASQNAQNVELLRGNAV